MTLTDKTELVLEVLRGAEVPALARAQKLPPRTLHGWVRDFLRAGIAALYREEDGDREEGDGVNLAPIIPLYHQPKPRGWRRQSAKRGRR